jgi:peptide/nickel transport system permease protein
MRRSDLLLFWNTINGRTLYKIGFILVALNIFLLIFGPMIAPYDPVQSNPSEALAPPSLKHLFGTDRVGMDVFSRTIVAPRIDLAIALGANLISFTFGSLLGVISGYYRTWWADSIARTLDLIQVFPSFVLAMTAVAIFGQSNLNIILVIGIFNIPIYARLVRSKVYSIREMKFVEAAISLGNTDLRLLAKHVLPASIQPAYVQFSVVVGWVILLTSSLSFIGVGVKPPTPEWGSMVSIGVPQIISGQWWISIFPGVALALCVLGFAIVGDAIDVVVDPLRR